MIISKIKNFNNIPEEEILRHEVRLKLEQGYILSPASKVPPGDCLIIEFGPEKAKTEHICGFNHRRFVEEEQFNKRVEALEDKRTSRKDRW